MNEKFLVNGGQVKPEQIIVTWVDDFGYEHEGDIWDWRQSEIEDFEANIRKY